MRSARWVVVLAFLVAAACGGTSDEGSGEARATIRMFEFRPSAIRVEPGGSVTWTNRDEILHTVTAGPSETPSSQFDEELPGQGTTASVTFEEPGTYAYFCSRHTFMVGTVSVG